MVGRKVSSMVDKPDIEPGEVVLLVENLTVKSKLHNKKVVNDVSFKVRSGEIVCVAGIDGNGQSELVYALTGITPADSGQVVLNGKHLEGKSVGTVDVAATDVETMSEMMVGRKVSRMVDKPEIEPGETVLEIRNLTVKSKIHHKTVVNDVSFNVRAGEIVCIAGIDGNGQSELVYAITGINPADSGDVKLNGVSLSAKSIREHSKAGIAHIPEDRHRHGLVLDYNLAYNLILEKYYTPHFQKSGFLRFGEIYKYSDMLIEKYDIRSGEGAHTPARSLSGGNQQKAIIARELDLNPNLLVAVQPTRGLDVGAIEYIHSQIVKARCDGAGVLLVSLELDEVMNVSDRILVMFEGEIVADVDPKKVTFAELGLYMSGAKRDEVSV